MENTEIYGRRRERRWTPTRAKAQDGISRACAHLFFSHVFHAGMHFSNTRPVEFRRLAAVSDTQRRPTCTRCSCLVVCAIYVWGGVLQGKAWSCISQRSYAG